jgi:DNA-binding beta-propeller fold protein YncE
LAYYGSAPVVESPVRWKSAALDNKDNAMRKALQSTGIVGLCLLGTLACSQSEPEGIVAARSGLSVAQVPQFRAEGSWPKLPSQWIMAVVASTWIDQQDHLWVLQRPNTLSAAERPRAAAPVLEFDAQGTFIQAWGGPGAGYDWPETEHGIYIDPRGFVWIGGNRNDDQILKFTRAGEFVMQIGTGGMPKSNADTANLWRPADMFVHAPTNELFVADGYGNKRIIVFDADTGAFKRMWGAFGNTPADDVRTSAGGDAGPTLHALGPDGDFQFVPPVHAVKVSTDGLVYVADRGGRRVQIFTLAGRFVDQVFIGRECRAPDCGNGQTAAGIGFSPDTEQRYLYVANRSQAQIMVFDRKSLSFLDAFGSWGSGPGQFGTLHHLSVDSQGNLYTAEVTPLQPENRRVQKFTLTGFAPLPVVSKNR